MNVLLGQKLNWCKQLSILIQFFSRYHCHVHMREILSCLHILKTTSMFYMYEATIVNKILMQVL